MAKPEVALYDPDRTYVDRFLRYCSARKNINFELVGFSNRSVLEKYLSRQKPALLLLFEEESDSFKLRDFSKPEEESSSIEKYQSAELILSKIRLLLPVQSIPQNTSGKGDTGFLGVYSPTGGAGHVTYSLALAEKYALKAPVLYVNLDRFSGLSEMTGRPEEGLSELIMHRLRGKEEFERNFSFAIGHMGKFDVLTAPANMEDIDELSAAEWADFFRDIKRLGGYGVLILDFSEGFREIDWLFDMCKEIHVPVDGSLIDSARIKELKEFLKDLGREDLAQKLIEIEQRHGEPEFLM